MADHQDNINQLLARLEFLQQRQDDFTKEINQLRDEVIRLKASEENTPPTQVTGNEEAKQTQSLNKNMNNEN